MNWGVDQAQLAVTVVLRATRKLFVQLPPARAAAPPSDTALGDWYVNRLVVDRRPLLLLVSSTSLFPILTPARSVNELPTRLVDLVTSRLRRIGIDWEVVDHEAAAMSPVWTAPTRDRSVVGIMVDFAKAIPFYLKAGAWDESTLPFVEGRLAETPCHAGLSHEQVIWPEQKATALLAERWAAG